MECSPTDVVRLSPCASYVAVPVNYGMLSYLLGWFGRESELVAVPVNYGMLSYKVIEKLETQYSVAVPVNYGMLSYVARVFRLQRV